MAIYLSLGLQIIRPSQRRSSALKREHPALQIVKLLNFFLFLWEIFAHLRIRILPIKIKADPSGSKEIIKNI
jgi:hypothetical protein